MEDKHSVCGLLRVRGGFIKLFTGEGIVPGMKLCEHCRRLQAEKKGRDIRQDSRPDAPLSSP
jgi:hypothetical protein